MRPGRRRRSRQRPAALLFKLPLGVRVTWLSARLCGEHPEPEPDQAGVRHACLTCTCAREQNAFATWCWAPRRWSPPIPAPRLRATFPAPTTDSSGVRGGHSTQQLEAARGGRPGAGRSGAAQGTCLAFEGPRVLLQQRQRRPAAGRVGSGPETPAPRRGARQALQGDAPCSPPFHTRRRRRDPCTASIPRWAQTPPSRLCRNGNNGAGRKDRENPISLCKLPAGREA